MFFVQLNEVLSVEGQYGSSQAKCKGQNFIIRNCLLCLAGFQNRQDIVPQTAQFINDWLWEIFVGIEHCHVSGILIFTDCLLDLITARSYIGPSVNKILSPQRGIHLQNLSFACTQATSLLQHPDRYSGTYDAGFSAANPRATFDTWQDIS